jgi:signal transduction histidine kinase
MISRAFQNAGFSTASAAQPSELDLHEGARPVAFILDDCPPGQTEPQLARLRRLSPDADVWSISQAVKLVGGRRSNGTAPESTPERVSCEGILKQALTELRHGESGNAAPQARPAPAWPECENILNALPDPVFVVSRDGVLTHVNAALCKLFDSQPRELVGRPCGDLLGGRFEPWSFKHVEQVVTTSGPVRWRLRDTASDKTYDCVAFQAALRDEAVGAAHHLRQVGSENTRTDVLQKAAAAAVHELSNPLGAVLGLAELIEDADSCPPDVRKDARVIRHEAWRCRRIVGNLLHLSSPRRPVMPPANLNELLEHSIIVRGCQEETQDVQITRDLAPDLPAIMADPDHVEQIILNLLTNAQEALADDTEARRGGPPRVTVATRQDGDDVVLSVADNGPGIPPDKLESIFKPLFTDKPKGGTGIGLSVSRTLARQHGGDITAENLPEGGARFVLRLPVTGAADTAPDSDG